MRGLVAYATHCTLDAAVADRRRLQRELRAAAETLRHPWRVRVRYRKDGSAAYCARICRGTTVLQRRCDSIEEAQSWLRETARARGLREEPIDHLWDGQPLVVRPPARKRLRSNSPSSDGKPDPQSRRLWEPAG